MLQRNVFNTYYILMAKLKLEISIADFLNLKLSIEKQNLHKIKKIY